MEDPNLFSRYEQRENTGKVVGEGKYQPKAIKDVERNLTALGKKITELQRHRKRAYNNSVKVKKSIHHQVNQIVRSFRDRERTLLADVDESYISQVSSIDAELEKLLSANASCQFLYSGLYGFRENQNIICDINNTLSKFNLDEKPEYKRLELISSVEQAKLYANSYGNLDGEFVKKDVAAAAIEDGGLSAIDQEHSPYKVVPEQICADVKVKISEKNHKRERTESQDSFEIVELLESIHCHDNKDFLDEKNKCKDHLNSSTEDDSDNFTEDFPESSAETLKNSSKKEDYLCLEERLMKMNKQLETIVSSAPKFNAPREKMIKPVKQVQSSEEKTGSSKSHAGYKSWLCKTPKIINAMEIDDVGNDSGANTSPADVIKKAFSPYVANQNIESWLASKH